MKKPHTMPLWRHSATCSTQWCSADFPQVCTVICDNLEHHRILFRGQKLEKVRILCVFYSQNETEMTRNWRTSVQIDIFRH